MSNFTNASYWEQVAISTVTVSAGGPSALLMSPSHVYYANGTYFIRYNRAASYTSGGSWEKYAFSNLSLTFFNNPNNPESLNGSNAGGYDGRYMYFAPRWCGQYVRYDTQGAFNNAGSWGTVSVTDVTSVDTNLGAHIGFTMLGNYIYYCPYGAGHFVRFNKTLSFASGSFQAKAKSDISSQNYVGTCNDGRYVYYGPYYNTYFVRYDSQGTFTDTGAWEKVDRATIGLFGESHLEAFHPVCDGRYVYYGTDNATSFVARYDTLGSFSSSGSWEKATKATIGLSGGAIYFSCVRGGYVFGYDSVNGKCICYDTTKSFTSASAWESAGSAIIGDTGLHDMGYGDAYDDYVYYKSGDDEYVRFNGGPNPPICWNYTARFKGSSKLFKISGPGAFPKKIIVPGNVDRSTGRLVDDGIEIDPCDYKVI